MGDNETTDEPAQAASEPAESGESEQAEAAPEAPVEETSDESGDDQPEIESEEKAVIPDDVEIDATDVEAETAAEEDGDNADTASDSETGSESQGGDSPDGIGPEGDTADGSPFKAGELYVTLVQKTTNGAIRSQGGETDALDRKHFEDYNLAHYFDATMDEMGVGSDMEPHEALVLSTALAVGDGMLTETDVLDSQIDQLMDKAVQGGAA